MDCLYLLAIFRFDWPISKRFFHLGCSIHWWCCKPTSTSRIQNVLFECQPKKKTISIDTCLVAMVTVGSGYCKNMLFSSGVSPGAFQHTFASRAQSHQAPEWVSPGSMGSPYPLKCFTFHISLMFTETGRDAWQCPKLALVLRFCSM